MRIYANYLYALALYTQKSLLCVMAKKKTPKDSDIPDTQKLANRIKQLRKIRGYSNSLTFSIDNDLNPSQFARYESGQGNITWKNLMKVIRALDVDVSEFFSEGFD